MRFAEFSVGLQHFKATVRVGNGTNKMAVTTVVAAQSVTQAQFLLRNLFGNDAVLHLVRLYV